MISGKMQVSVHDMRGEVLRENNDDVQSFITSAQIYLKANGWKYEGQRIVSALYERSYTKGTQTIVIGGWHGTGKRGTCRWWGDGKSFMNLWHREGFKTLRIVECNHSQDSIALVISKQADAMEEALRYITAL